MPARRPYASRGVQRRASPYRSSGRRGPGRSSAALIAVLALVAGGCVWVVHPAWFGEPAALIQELAHSTSSGPSNAGSRPRLADVSGANGPESVLDTGRPALPAATPAGANTTPTTGPTLRRWDTASTGLVTDAILADRLDQALSGVDGRVSVAVKDLGSGRGAVLEADREMPAASLYKLPVLYSVFQAGLRMSEELTITDEARSYDAGTLELGVGETLTVAEALERMVTISDNASAIMLGSRVGSSRVNADIAALGLDSTHYSLERMTTSAADMLRLLEQVAYGQAVSPAASADMLHLLLRQRVNDRLPRFLPGDVEVAHKTGNLPGTVNDVGILYGPSSTVAVAVLISETTDETTAATAVARVAQAAYLYFGGEPEAPGRPTIPRPPARAVPPVWRQPRPVLPTPTLEPTSVPAPSVGPEVAQPTPVNTPLPLATLPPVATTTIAPQIAPTQPPPTPTLVLRPAVPTATSAIPPPTRAPARAPTPTPPPRR
ncbi:MAG: serine hydrolase [Chloroflexota bacterium]